MAFNSSGVYSRIDNSFSNPVVGTTISPTDADTYFDDIDAALNAYYGTSTSSVAIGVGTKTFTTQTGKLFGTGRFIFIRSDASAANWMFGQVSSYSSTTLGVSVIAYGGSGTLSDWTIYIAGAQGAVGPVAGIRQKFDSSTTDSDPGDGDFRFNHATPSSATAIYLDNLDTFGATVSGIIDRWDDSTSTTRGFLHVEKEGDASVWAEFTVTGSVVDGTGYRKLTLTAGASNGTFTAADAFRIAFIPKGDKGADGSGTFPGSSTDNAFARFDGTGGTTVQNSSVTCDDSNNVAGMATLTLPNTGLHILDTNASHDLIIAPGSDLTADRTLTITTGDANRTLTLSADATITGSPVEQGKHTVSIPAAAFWARTTNGAGAASRELTTGDDIMVKGYAFDTTTEEAIQFYIAWPKSWNEGTLTARFFWTNAGGGSTETVVWGISGASLANDDPIDSTSLGTEVTQSDTWIAQNDVHVTDETSAITLSNTPAEGDLTIFQVARKVGSDNMTGDADLLAVQLFYTVNAATDA